MSELSHLKVLIVDDHLLIRQCVRNSLQTFKVDNVQTAADGTIAVELIMKERDAGEPYDIVFLDWNMPTISGLEVLSYFRANAEHADTAFVMLTVESEQRNIMKAVKAGATSYILKPVSQAALGDKVLVIDQWITRKRKHSKEARC